MGLKETAEPLPSLPESYRTIPVFAKLPWFRKLLAFAGPGYLVAVGYMDPGNWATDIAGGSKFGFALLSVILLSNFMAMFLQALCARLGIVTGRDLAQSCRDHFSRPVNFGLWLLCEVAIAACDLAEVLGSAIALKLLFGLPLLLGVVVTVADVLLLLLFQNRGFRLLEGIVITLIVTIGACFGYLLFVAHPNVADVARGFLPTMSLIRNPEMLYIGIGILGATVMPHNLYLHSSIVQTRAFQRDPEGKREAIFFATLDSSVALLFALFINAAILIVAAATFHRQGMFEVSEIEQAYKLLTPAVGAALASTLFAVALLASGQNSTLTGTLAGQIVMEGFLSIKLAPWIRRLITRLIAVVPAILVLAIRGEREVGNLLVLSQVILSFQLPFAIVPLLMFTSSKEKMGEFVNSRLTTTFGVIVATLIIGLNGFLLYRTFVPA